MRAYMDGLDNDRDYLVSEYDRLEERDWLEEEWQLRESVRPTLDGDDEVYFLTDDELDALWADLQEGL